MRILAARSKTGDAAKSPGRFCFEFRDSLSCKCIQGRPALTGPILRLLPRKTHSTCLPALFRSILLGLCACEASAAEPDLAAAAKRVTQIVAHRGASAERPECTLSAIERAIEAGATAVELNVRTSRDGKLFILHDATLDRTTNGSGPAGDRTLAGLQALDAGSWFGSAHAGARIPSLIEAARACHGRIDLFTQRVGVTGVSTGGLLALSAAAMEPRIAAASVQGILGSMRVSFIRDRHRHCKCGAIPGLLPEFDLPELALLVAPRSLHISNGQGFGPDEARRCLERIAPYYVGLGGSSRDRHFRGSCAQ